jgi:nonsense-mediated mRNA decay protein 3
MSFKKFCPKCGKETDILINGVCKECYLGNSDLFVIKEINIDLCGRCGKIKSGLKWVLRSDVEIINEIIKKIKPVSEIEQMKPFVELNQKDDTTYLVEVKVMGILNGIVVEQKKDFVLDLNKTICDPCMRLSSDYREAIIQLRTSKGVIESGAMLKLAEEFIEQEKQNDSLSGIVKILRTKNGFDIWLGSGKAGAKISNHLGKIYKTKVLTSKKLIGEDQGKRKFRYTFLIRN